MEKKKKMISSSLPLPFRPAGPAPARSPLRRPIPFGLPLATLAAASSLQPVPTGPAKPHRLKPVRSPAQQPVTPHSPSFISLKTCPHTLCHRRLGPARQHHLPQLVSNTDTPSAEGVRAPAARAVALHSTMAVP